MNMNDDQLSEDPDIAAVQVLTGAAMTYAGRTITATTGVPPGPEAVAALDRARQLIARDGLPTPAAKALRDLQVVAVLFTVHLASDDRDDPALQRLEDKLVATLESQDAPRVLSSHDGAAAAQALGDRAFDYARQIIVAEESDAPIRSDAVGRVKMDLQAAAITFTVQLAIAEGHAPEMLRQLSKLLAMMPQGSA